MLRLSIEKCLISEMNISLTWFYMSEVKVMNEVNVIPRPNCKCLISYWKTGGGFSCLSLSAFLTIYFHYICFEIYICLHLLLKLGEVLEIQKETEENVYLVFTGQCRAIQM